MIALPLGIKTSGTGGDQKHRKYAPGAAWSRPSPWTAMFGDSVAGRTTKTTSESAQTASQQKHGRSQSYEQGRSSPPGIRARKRSVRPLGALVADGTAAPARHVGAVDALEHRAAPPAHALEEARPYRLALPCELQRARRHADPADTRLHCVLLQPRRAADVRRDVLARGAVRQWFGFCRFCICGQATTETETGSRGRDGEVGQRQRGKKKSGTTRVDSSEAQEGSISVSNEKARWGGPG